MNGRVAPAGVLIVPGLFGSSEGHWQRIWHAERPGTRLLEQPDCDHPRLDAWLEALEQALRQQEEAETYIVAHSLGCLLTARLAGRPAARRVRGAFLVAPCDLARTEALHPGRIAFGAMPAEPLPFPSLIIGSLDDPYMPPDALARFGRDLDTPAHTLGAVGHINIDSGFGRWTQGYGLFDAFRAGIETGRKAGAGGRRALPPSGSGHERLPAHAR